MELNERIDAFALEILWFDEDVEHVREYQQGYDKQERNHGDVRFFRTSR